MMLTRKSIAASPRDEQQANPSEEGKTSFEKDWEVLWEAKDELCINNLKETFHPTEDYTRRNDRYAIESTLDSSPSAPLIAMQQQETDSSSKANISENQERGRRNCFRNPQQTLQHDDGGDNDLERRNEARSVRNELKHLRKRITNIQQSIQLSDAALRSPSNWEKNCLNSVRNCIGEWRAIVSFHCESTLDCDSCLNDTVQEHRENSERHPMHPDSEGSKAAALEIFGLLQIAMQCGPLTGSNAGYFKRCGGTIAMTAHKFLIASVAGDVVQDLRFTEKQHDAVGRWIIAAKKAAEINRPPSKHMLKLQQKVTNKKRGKGNSMG